ncbi:hypothetical protein CHUAL_002959 [Chamberlinius hualienensis]
MSSKKSNSSESGSVKKAVEKQTSIKKKNGDGNHKQSSTRSSHQQPLIHQTSLPPPLPPRRPSFDPTNRHSRFDPTHRRSTLGYLIDQYNVLVLERKVLLGVTGLTVLGFLLWIVSVSTDYWFMVQVTSGATYLNKTKTYFVRSNSGLWRICRTEFRNQTGSTDQAVITMCRYHQLFPSNQEFRRNPQIDRTILHYTRTETAFSIISIFLMVMGFGFSIYTFHEPRYMFKRLASGVHFLTAATVLVVVEVLINSVNYESQYLHERHPQGANWYYGFSFFLACFTFAFYIIAGCAFLICSRKRKGDKAPSELYALADEPHILGRV